MADQGYFRQDLPFGFASLVQRVSAAVVAFGSLRVLMVAYGTDLSDAYQALLIIVMLLTLILFRGPQSTEHHLTPRFWNTAISVFWTWCILFGVLLVLGYATKTSTIYSRKLLLSWAVLAPVLILLVRVTLDRMLARLVQSRINKRRAVIAGVNEHAMLLANKIRQSPHLGLSLDGHFDDRGLERLGGQMEPGMLLGRLAELPGYVRARRIDLIYITLPMRNIQRVTELLDELHDTTASIYYVPDVFVFDLIQCRTDEIDGLPVVALCESPFYGSRGVVKRTSDFMFALGILVLISPILLVIALAVKLTTNGSVIFKQRRYGLDGREISVYKFRTMSVSEDDDEVRQVTRDDKRVTPVGAFLRRYSLDELPQFINVLQGRMSVVGPRPHAVAHNEEYRRLIKGYMIRHKVTPGVTGLAQVRGFRGETATVEDMRRRVEADLEYLRKWSLELDLRIIFRTVVMMFSDKKAY
jgi:putative colanic acid biosynthesis UDP-glucose lipid carrier transferase